MLRLRIIYERFNHRILFHSAPLRRATVDVYSIGTGVFGALGHGDLYDIKHFRRIELDDIDIHSIASGWGHSAIVSTKGLIIFGRPFDFISLLRINRLHKSFFPILGRVASGITAWFGDKGGLYVNPRWFSFANITSLASSAGLTVFVTHNGEVFSFGGNRWGQCGVDNDNHLHIFSPSPMKSLSSPIQSVDTGLQHVIALSKDGKVYTWGKGERGQLGNGEKENNHNPLNIAFNHKAVCVSAGFAHSAVVLDDGTLYIWGRGLSDTKKVKYSGPLRLFEDQLVPRHVPLPGSRKAVKVLSSNFNIVILADDNTLWVMGVGEHDRNMNSKPLPVHLYDTDWNSNNSDSNSPLIPCVVDVSVRLQKGYKRVILFDMTSKISDTRKAMRLFATPTTDTVAYNKYASIAFEVVLHADEAFLQPMDLPGLPPNGLLLDLSVGWQHKLALVKEVKSNE